MKLTLEQQKEKMAFKYPRSYYGWLEVALRLGYGTVTAMLMDFYWGPNPGGTPIRTMEDVARLTGFTAMSVSNVLKKLGIPARPPAHRDSGFHFTRQGGR